MYTYTFYFGKSGPLGCALYNPGGVHAGKAAPTAAARERCVGTSWINLLGLSILPAYLVVTILLGWWSRQRDGGANDFLNASRSLPLWIVVGAFLSANCGALEIVGLSAVAAQYGVQAFHFYWIGAIPGMVFLGAIMIPLYMHTGVRSLPEYLERRFDARVRLFNAWLLLGAGTALAGIGLYAMAQVLHVVFGWPFTGSAVLAACVVLAYVLMGGLRATIYNEVFQLLVIVVGLSSLLFLPTTHFHSAAAFQGSHAHLWQGLPGVAPHAEMDKLGVFVGLGFVLSFSYWCTDFVLVQRALTARTPDEGRMVPLLAGFGKLGFSLLVITPALGAAAYLGPRMPAAFDQTLPALMAASYGPVQLGLGMTALLASLMTGLAANISAFAALWTEEIYRAHMRPGAPEAHYIRMGRMASVVATVLSIATSYFAFHFRDLMEYVQMIFSLFSAPFFAVFLLGMFTRRATARGALAGLACGASLALAHHGLAAAGLVHYGSLMTANFYVAIYAFAASLAAGLLFSRGGERKSEAQLERLVWRPGVLRYAAPRWRWWMLAGLLLALCVALNVLWR